MRPGPVHDDWARLLFIAGESVARLFVTGGHHRVLRTLDDWLRDPRVNLRKLAVQAVVLMVEAPLSALGRPEREDADDLILQGDSGSGRDGGLRSSRCRTAIPTSSRRPQTSCAAPCAHRGVRSSPTSWSGGSTSGTTDDAALAAVESFLPRLVVEESDRARLRGLVRRRRRMWADPLPDEIADRLDSALASADAAPSGERVVVT